MQVTHMPRRCTRVRRVCGRCSAREHSALRRPRSCNGLFGSFIATLPARMGQRPLVGWAKRKRGPTPQSSALADLGSVRCWAALRLAQPTKAGPRCARHPPATARAAASQPRPNRRCSAAPSRDHRPGLALAPAARVVAPSSPASKASSTLPRRILSVVLR